MPFDLLNLLQALLLPLAVGTVVVVVLLVWLLGRLPARQRGHLDGPAAAPPAAAAPAARAAAPAAPAAPQDPSAGMPTWQPPAAIAPLPDLVLPVAAVPPADQPHPTPPTAAMATAASARPRKADLLLVDDSAVVRTRLRRLFQPAGYSLALAADGEAALTLLAEGRYGLLLTDLEMPRLDGVGLIRAVMADPVHAAMPVLAITGHDDLQGQLHQLQAIAGIHRKPWDDDDLLGNVQALVAPSLRDDLAAEEA